MNVENVLELLAGMKISGPPVDPKDLQALECLSPETLSFIYYGCVALRADVLRTWPVDSEPGVYERTEFLEYTLNRSTLLMAAIRNILPEQPSLITHFSKKK